LAEKFSAPHYAGRNNVSHRWRDVRNCNLVKLEQFLTEKWLSWPLPACRQAGREGAALAYPP